jgi:uncharacterized lipoprotein YajG
MIGFFGVLRRGMAAVGCLGLLLTAGCAYTPHDVQLAPTAQATASDAGQGAKVFFRFLDDRDDVNIGHRGVSTRGAKVSASDLPRMVEEKLRDSLQRKQFELVATEAAADSAVTYRLRSFKFEIEKGFFSGGRNAAAALSVDAHRGPQSYANVYRTNSETRIMFVPGGDEIDQQMNAALSDILQKANDDADLVKVLAGR